MVNKPRIVKDYEKLDPEIQEQIKLNYPYGFHRNLIQYKNVEGKFVSALPFETEDRYYLVRMTLVEAKQIVEDDDDYNARGELKESIKEDYEEKYGDLDHLTISDGVPDEIGDDDDDVDDVDNAGDEDDED
jgi:hypothetical protein